MTATPASRDVMAEKMARSCLQSRELRIISDGSLAFNAMGNRRALKGSEKVLGVNHPDTLTSVGNLASVLQHQGKYDEAARMNRRALEGREKVLRVYHPDTLTSVYCLAHLLAARDEHHEALALYHRASSGFVKVLGLDHPTTLACQKHQESVLESLRTESPSGNDRTSDWCGSVARARNRTAQEVVGNISFSYAGSYLTVVLRLNVTGVGEMRLWWRWLI